MSYFNTCNATGNELATRAAATRTQDAAVLALFERAPLATPWEVQAATGMLITSVRRAMTNLTKAGALVKTTQYRAGPQGHVEHLWARAA